MKGTINLTMNFVDNFKLTFSALTPALSSARKLKGAQTSIFILTPKFAEVWMAVSSLQLRVARIAFLDHWILLVDRKLPRFPRHAMNDVCRPAELSPGSA